MADLDLVKKNSRKKSKNNDNNSNENSNEDIMDISSYFPGIFNTILLRSAEGNKLSNCLKSSRVVVCVNRNFIQNGPIHGM